MAFPFHFSAHPSPLFAHWVKPSTRGRPCVLHKYKTRTPPEPPSPYQYKLNERSLTVISLVLSMMKVMMTTLVLVQMGCMSWDLDCLLGRNLQK